MIERIGHVKISARIQRDRPRIIELPRLAAGPANDLHRLTVRVKDLDAAISKLADKNVTGFVHRHVIGIT